jgi:hypothetical protein
MKLPFSPDSRPISFPTAIDTSKSIEIGTETSLTRHRSAHPGLDASQEWLASHGHDVMPSALQRFSMLAVATTRAISREGDEGQLRGHLAGSTLFAVTAVQQGKPRDGGVLH